MHPKGTFCPAGAILGIISAGLEDAADRVRRSASCCQSRTGLKVESKSKRSQSRRGIPYLKVELGLHYALLFHDSGIYPVLLTISHGDLFQDMVLEVG